MNFLEIVDEIKCHCEQSVAIQDNLIKNQNKEELRLNLI